MLDDLMGVMMAGVDTSAHAFCTTLYFLKKNPTKLEKLVKELKAHGFDNSTDMVEHLNKDTIEELDYLSYCIKETLRMDSPTVDTLNYAAKEDIKICGVDISKGQYIKLNLYASNHAIKEHQKPFDFIPERFDPESEYFTRPGDNKTRSVYSHIPFSHGQRGCPGQSLAILQMKVGTLSSIFSLIKVHTCLSIR
jgi:cytochrome P450